MAPKNDELLRSFKAVNDSSNKRNMALVNYLDVLEEVRSHMPEHTFQTLTRLENSIKDRCRLIYQHDKELSQCLPKKPVNSRLYNTENIQERCSTIDDEVEKVEKTLESLKEQFMGRNQLMDSILRNKQTLH